MSSNLSCKNRVSVRFKIPIHSCGSYDHAEKKTKVRQGSRIWFHLPEREFDVGVWCLVCTQTLWQCTQTLHHSSFLWHIPRRIPLKTTISSCSTDMQTFYPCFDSEEWSQEMDWWRYAPILERHSRDWSSCFHSLYLREMSSYTTSQVGSRRIKMVISFLFLIDLSEPHKCHTQQGIFLNLTDIDIYIEDSIFYSRIIGRFLA